jgi:anti-anti-sigma regulatory factor
VFTARTAEAAGIIRTRGQLDGVGAEALCRIVDALRQLGHRQIAVQLGPTTTADDDAHEVLADHAQQLRTEGVRLLVE